MATLLEVLSLGCDMFYELFDTGYSVDRDLLNKSESN